MECSTLLSLSIVAQPKSMSRISAVLESDLNMTFSGLISAVFRTFEELALGKEAQSLSYADALPL